MTEQLLTTPIARGSNMSAAEELVNCTHDNKTFKYRAYSFTYLLVFPVAFACNTGALVVFLLQCRRRRCSTSVVVMMNLALSDSSFSLTLPLRLAYYFNNGVWDFPDWLCRVCGYGFYVNLYTSILFLTLLSLLRWLAVSRPLHHSALATPTRTLLVCLGIWAFVAACCSPFSFEGVSTRSGLRHCFEPSNPSSLGLMLILNYVGLAVGFLLPFITLIICYSSIIHHLMAKSDVRSNESSGILRSKRRRSVHLVTMVTVTFLFCFLPYHLFRTLHLHALYGGWRCDVQSALQQVVVVTLCLAASNCVVNPLLYYYATKSFRDNLTRVRSSVLSSTGRSADTRRSRWRRVLTPEETPGTSHVELYHCALQSESTAESSPQQMHHSQ
ncbi:cysteinyl leukotriene receptor 1 isoform X1 [Scophthalmus maximus]|uniref:cysteinyl leukotriene receptor 1 isoform X1 n=2 Tax=Scophthalmus maximus TaxID=52904 RepID=UPI000F2EAD37|nr:cysteinyl leukotriene receptor 1 isoform X1 [Scophthalmus maximus]